MSIVHGGTIPSQMSVEVTISEISITAVKHGLVDSGTEFCPGGRGLESDPRRTGGGDGCLLLLDVMLFLLQGIRLAMGPSSVILATGGTSLVKKPLTICRKWMLMRGG